MLLFCAAQRHYCVAVWASPVSLLRVHRGYLMQETLLKLHVSVSDAAATWRDWIFIMRNLVSGVGGGGEVGKVVVCSVTCGSHRPPALGTHQDMMLWLLVTL